MLKNLAVVPKAVYVASLSGLKKVNHIHAHWGSTTATMAYIVSGLTDIPWSMTLHRWDIAENNLLVEKIRSAKFVVAISEHGKDELLGITKNAYKEKIGVLHLGVEVPKIPPIMNDEQKKSIFKIAVPANLVEKKGHKYLVEACFLLVKQGVENFQCFFYGDGPLSKKLVNYICEKNLGKYITLQGALPHEELIKMYETKSIDSVVMPSIVTGKGECEGIPVSLMEAMAYGIPVISTNTGGIPELLGEGAGLLVEPSSSKALAETITFLIQNADIRDKLRKKGYERVKNDFNINLNVQKLLNLMENRTEGK
jgi:glycosyltransferase involved in cell wall biosynthesis